MISFDIEGFVESSHDVMRVPEKYLDDERDTTEMEANTRAILEFLAKHNQKATFFILGRIARDRPSLVQAIAEGGHEIACHSFHHRRLYSFDEAEVRMFVAEAKRRLEDVSGKPVYGFRAPEFSILSSNEWVFDALRDAGYLYDSSVYPTGLHDVYGIAGFPKKPFRLKNGLLEVPMSVFSFLNRDIPFGGGGYLRLYPGVMTRFLLRHINRKGLPGVVYCHPYEFGELAPYIAEMQLGRRIRTYVGRRSVRRKLADLIAGFRLVTIKEYSDACHLT